MDQAVQETTPEETGETPVLVEARQRFSDALAADHDNRIAIADDLKWAANEQWTATEQAERKRDGRIPLLTFNRFGQFIKQVSGDVRRNPPSIKCHPGEGADSETADVMGGLIRSIEHRSQARRIYAKAVEQAAACGRGHFQLSLEYADDVLSTSAMGGLFEMDVFIRGIRNPLAVVWDPSAARPDRSDARFCFVYDDLDESVFKARFPHAQLSSWAAGEAGEAFHWRRHNTIRVANYWVVKHERTLIVLMSNGDVIEAPKDPEELQPKLQEYAARGVQPVRTRYVMRRKVCVYLMTGSEILAGPIDWPGSRIPVFTVWGEEVDVGDQVVNHGMVRFQKDAQRVHNLAFTAELETLQMATKAPFMGTQKQFGDRLADWANAHRGNKPLIWTHDDKVAGPPQRIQPPVANNAAIALADRAQDAMKAGTGVYDAALGAKSNETSGRAILARQQESDTANVVYVDNLAAAMQACGEALVEVIPKIYDTPRTVRILGVDEAPAIVRVNDGRYDLNRGKYDIIVQVGPAYATKRMEAADTMLEVVKALPPPFAVALFPLIAKNLDFPEHDEIAAIIGAVAGAMGIPMPGQPGMPGAPGLPMGAGPGLPMGGPPMGAAGGNVIPFAPLPGGPGPRPPMGPQGAAPGMFAPIPAFAPPPDLQRMAPMGRA